MLRFHLYGSYQTNTRHKKNDSQNTANSYRFDVVRSAFAIYKHHGSTNQILLFQEQ